MWRSATVVSCCIFLVTAGTGETVMKLYDHLSVELKNIKTAKL